MDLAEYLKEKPTTVADLLYHALTVHQDRIAIEEPEQCTSYKELSRLVAFVSEQVRHHDKVAILASRSLASYGGILGTVYGGGTYIPLNKRFPVPRMQKILANTQCKQMVVGEECSGLLEQLIDAGLTGEIICPAPGPELQKLSVQFPHLNWVMPEGSHTLKAPEPFDPADSIYILFTSGTTGEPKGIVVNHHNVVSYLRNFLTLYPLKPDDKASQLFDTSFDVSVHDIFASLTSGATLCVIPEDSVMAPAHYIKQYQLTFWFSVPSVPMFMDKFRMLSEGAFPTLRLCCFAGEALPANTMIKWQKAAPNARCINMYGPTEATIVISHFPWEPHYQAAQFENEITPIGQPFDDTPLMILDEQQQAVAQGCAGELYIGGPQVTDGYLNNAKLSDQKFVTLDCAPETRWYRSGDLVKQSAHGYEFLGRIDDQIQLRGFRVELAEIDRVIRNAAGHELAISVPIGLVGGRADELYAVVQGEKGKESRKQIVSQCKKNLPDYMVPGKVKFIDKMPLNINGKIDRKALMKAFED